MKALQCSSLSVRLNRKWVISNVSLDVEIGSWTTLIGRNGAGKTSLLRAIAGLIPYEGTVSISNRNQILDLKALSLRERALKIAYLPQNPVLPTGVTVRDYVLCGRSPHVPLFGTEKPKDFEIVDQVLHQLNIYSLSKRRLEEISGGERQRVTLGRALAQQSQIILLDEPTTSLDIGHQQDVLELIDELRQTNGLTVLSTMHELSLAGQYSDELALIAAGKIVARGQAREILTDDLIGTHYGAKVKVKYLDGAFVITPLRLNSPLSNPLNGPAIHQHYQ